PLQGFYDKVKASPARMMAEFRDEDLNDDELGKPMAVDIFSEGDIVNVKGVSKGKGFAGVMKRFGFAGAPASRGSHESFRGGGSIGMHTYPGRVFKNKEMPGHMGSETVHVKNLRVVRVDKEQNLLLIRGAIPGAKGNIIKIIKSRSAKA
ncbi:MAG: 50S ribosomal protein L3, partial [Nitrospinales bacterium]